MYRFCIFCIVLCFASSFALPVFPCEAKEGKFGNLSLSCEGVTECLLKRNTNVTINIQFKALENVKTLTSVVHGIIEGLPVPFPLPNPDACVNSGLQCPLKNGTIYNYTASLFVKKSYPKVRVTVQWELKDENNQNVICLKIPARIN